MQQEKKQKKKEIDGTLYAVTMLDAISALKIQTMLIKILGAGLPAILTESQKSKNTNGLTEKVLSAVIPALMQGFDDETTNKLVLKLFERNVFIVKSGALTILDFEDHFIGKPLTMWKVAAFILEVNFNLGELKGSSLHTTEEDKSSQGN